MGRKKKVDEIADIAPELAAAAEDGVITEDEIKDIIDDDEGTDTENVGADDVVGDGVEDNAPETDEFKEDTPVPSEEEVKAAELTPVEGEGDSETDDNADKEETPVEPTVDPKPTDVQDKPAVELEEPKYTPEQNLLNDANATMEDKIGWCLAAAPIKARNIAKQLEAYNVAMKPGVVHDEQKMLGKQYELVSIFRSVFKAESYAEFKTRFDVLNLFFNYYSKEAFSAHLLVRFDHLWKWSDKELETLLNLTEVVSQLCVAPERKKRLKQLNLEMALNPEKTIVSEDAKNNIIRYYTK